MDNALDMCVDYADIATPSYHDPDQSNRIVTVEQVFGQRRFREQSQTFARVQAHIDGNLKENFTVADVAEALGVSKTTISRALRVHNFTFRALVRERRLQRALWLLTHTFETLPVVAASCGFCNSSHLGVAVRKALGITPVAFRKKAIRLSEHAFNA